MLILAFSYLIFSSAFTICAFLGSTFPLLRWILLGLLRLWPWCLLKLSYCRFDQQYKRLVPTPANIWLNFSWKRWKWLSSGLFVKKKAFGQCNEWIESKFPVLQLSDKHDCQQHSQQYQQILQKLPWKVEGC